MFKPFNGDLRQETENRSEAGPRLGQTRQYPRDSGLEAWSATRIYQLGAVLLQTSTVPERNERGTLWNLKASMT